MISTNQRRVAAGMAVGLLSGVALAPQAAAATVDGVWRTDGYGAVIEIANGEARPYETTGISCVAGKPVPRSTDPDGTTRFGTFTFRAHGDTATQHIDGSVDTGACVDWARSPRSAPYRNPTVLCGLSMSSGPPMPRTTRSSGSRGSTGTRSGSATGRACART